MGGTLAPGLVLNRADPAASTFTVSAKDPISAALDTIPGGAFIITSAFDGVRSGVIARSVQPCADEPRLVCVAVRKGHTVEPLIRDSRCFALCRVARTDRLVMRKFEMSADHDPEKPQDPFDAFAIETMTTGSPILRKSDLVLDCEVVRHFDLEADCELFIGLVLAARIGPSAGP
ncbi:MAG: flavin reductase [Phycisphaeraceae bacterium]|nr:flavin reductase [Phycisphaeraceae bacterium]MCW5753708.1 flavin reductase [Phycisphaeraceae bacterium]